MATKKRTTKIILAVALTMLGLLLILGGIFMVLSANATRGNQIFPNVQVENIPVGGLTVAQAAPTLDQAMETAANHHAVTVQFPENVTIHITAYEAGIRPTGQSAAQIAFDHGRGGNLFTNAWAYFRARMFGVTVNPIAQTPASETHVQAALQSAADEITRNASATYEIDGEILRVTTGAFGVTLDSNVLTGQVITAFSSGSPAPISYTAETQAPTPLDASDLYARIATDPKDAHYNRDTDQIESHTVGIRFNVATAQQQIDAAPPGTVVEIPLTITQPDLTAERLEELLFRDVLGASMTTLIGDDGRSRNIELAASKINGLVLNPGEQFNFDAVVGHANAERGFFPAAGFSGSEVISVVGGGICQVSSTIYHALLHTEIQIDARSNHTLVVTYLPLGMDAAVSWGGPHFTFTNNLSFPIRIVTYRAGTEYRVRIYGTNESPYAKIVPEVVYINSVAFTTTYRDNPNLPVGTTQIITPGRIGHVVDVFQRFYDEQGNLLRREFVARSSYWAVAQVSYRGTAPPPAPPSEGEE